MDQRDRCKAFRAVLTAVVLGMLPAVRGVENVTSCVPPNASPAPNEPDLPNLPQVYRMEVEMTQEGGNQTQFFQQIVDTEGNRAVIRESIAGVQRTVVFSYATDEIFKFSGSQCITSNLMTDILRYLLWDQRTVFGRGHIPDGASTLFFGDQITKVFKGRQKIREIECDWWQSCFSISGLITHATVDYYFSRRDWTTPSKFQQAPVRYVVNGVVQGNAFKRTYDIFNFMPEANSDGTVFQTPPGVVCTNRKNTKDLPSLTSNYVHFKEEIIDVLSGVLTHAEVWYDKNSKLVRVDYRNADSTTASNNPLTVIHDFKLGVQYVKDLLTGQCTPKSLGDDKYDARVNISAFQISGKYVMTMQDPNSFFFINSNMTYVGQRRTRDVLCDVYISHTTNYDYYKNGSRLEATTETYFLADGWVNVPNDAFYQFSRQKPVRMYLNVPKVGLETVYNIIDLDTERHDPAVFDITDCYNDSSSIHFRVRFIGGAYHQDMEHMVKVSGYNALARTMQVHPLRVSRVNVEHDASYVYLSAVLLDRTPSLVQFTHLPNAVTERLNDASWGNVASAAACSDLCVNHPGFKCQSFEYCPADRGACRISRLHISEGPAAAVSSTCDLYSRSVNVDVPPELTVQQAWNKLWDGIKTMALTFEAAENAFDVGYAAVDAEITFGQLHSARRPPLTGQFSYRVEVVYPRKDLITTFDVWYDSVSKLVRFDTRDFNPGPPYYSPFAISHIHDFNSGVAYDIDTYHGNCTVGTIPTNNTLDVQALNWTSVHTTGIELLSIKSPLELFFLDDTYKFTGQKTVRGILCDVFESVRNDFTLGTGVQRSIFQYYFQSERWAYEADTGNSIVSQQPVQLVIMDNQAHDYIVYNFFDFNDDSASFDNFNIAPCFTDDQRIDFVLDFNQTYHPYLDAEESKFQRDVRLALSGEMHVSQLRIQNIQISYILDKTTFAATLLGQVSPQYHFSETGKMALYASPTVISNSDVVRCASSCYYDQTICNSFNLCPDQSCYLSTKHEPDGNLLDSTVLCRHFSRVVEGVRPGASLEDAYTSLKDVVYKGLVVVNMPVGDTSKTVPYTATSIRQASEQTTPNQESGGVDLHTRFKLYKTGSQMTTVAGSLGDMAVDDCAVTCYDEAAFTCASFSYCYTTGQCNLYDIRPADSTANVTTNVYCDLYTRLYLDDYQQYLGQVLQTAADDQVQVGGAEECARRCSAVSDFTCRSFDFCLTSGVCLLRHTHVLDPGAVTSNASLCSHYSRNYLSDFTRQTHMEVPGHDDTTVVGVSAATCAYECSKQRTCHSFEFCSGMCRLSSVVPASLSPVHSDNCNLYSLSADAAAILRRSTLNPAHSTKTTLGHSTHPTQPPASLTSASPTSTDAAANPAHPTKTTPGHSARPTHSTHPTEPPAYEFSTSATSASPTSSTGSGCQQRQVGSKSDDDTGPRVGIALGVLVGGMLLGAGIVLLVQYVRTRRNDDAAIELMPRMR